MEAHIRFKRLVLTGVPDGSTEEYLIKHIENRNPDMQVDEVELVPPKEQPDDGQDEWDDIIPPR